MLVHCDRCHEKVEGSIGDSSSAGVYVVDSGYWAMYARPFETVICDNCMWTDPKYIASYGQRQTV